MNFLGIGILEILLVLVVAMVVLGPGRTINMARTAGKALAEVRRAMADLSRAVELEDQPPGGGVAQGEEPDTKGTDPPGERR